MRWIAILLIVLTITPVTIFAQSEDKPTYEDTTTDEKKLPPSGTPDEKSSMEIEDLKVYGTRQTIVDDEKDLLHPPDDVTVPPGVPTTSEKAIMEIKQSLGEKSSLDSNGPGQQRKGLYRVTAELGTFTTIPFALFHANQLDQISYYINTGYEYSKGHVDNSSYRRAFLSGRGNYRLDDVSNLAVAGSIFENPYELYGRSSNPAWELKRRFREFEGSLILTSKVFNAFEMKASVTTNKMYLKHSIFDDLETWEDSEHSYETNLNFSRRWDEHFFAVDLIFNRTTIDYHRGNTFGMNYFQVQPKWMWTPFANAASLIGFNLVGYKTDDLDNRSTLFPYLKLTYRLTPEFVLSGTLKSAVKGHSLGDYCRINPFVDSTYTALPEYHPTEFEITMDYSLAPVTHLQLSWQTASIENLPLYVSNESDALDAPPYHTYLWSVSTTDALFGEEKITRHVVNANATFTPFDPFEFGLNLKFQSFSKYNIAYQPDQTIGFFADFKSGKIANIRFSLDIIGERFTGNSADIEPAKLDSYQLVNVDITRTIYKNVTGIIRGHNLTDSTTDVWQDYAQRGQAFFIGVMLDF